MAEIPDFSIGFQKQLLSTFFYDQDFLTLCASSISSDHFENEFDSIFADMMFRFKKEFPTDLITKDILIRHIKKRIEKKKSKKEDLPILVKTLSTILTPPKAPDYTKKYIKEFILNKTLENELLRSVDLLKKGEYQLIVDNLNETYSKVNSSEKTEDFSLVSDLSRRLEVLKDPEGFIKKDGISTPVEPLNNKLYRHGVGLGEMLIICGPPGRGKSIWLINIAAMAVTNGFNVLFYTLEMGQDIVFNRFDSCLTGIPFVDLYSKSKLVESRWSNIKKLKLGEMKLLDLPPRFLTPNMIRQHIRYYHAQGFFPQMLIVDYADIMASDKNITDRRLEHGDVYEQLRGIAKEFKIGCISASQANRDSLRKADVDIDSMAEDFSKAMTADYVIGLSQTKTEESERIDGRGTGRMRAFLAKNRNGVKGENIAVNCDFARMRVSMDDWDEFDRRIHSELTFSTRRLAA